MTEIDPQSGRGSQNPAVREAANTGSTLHSDKPGLLPDQLRARFPNSEFEFHSVGQDVEFINGVHPSAYEGSSWPEGVNFADFKPDTPSGRSTFNYDQKYKWAEPTTAAIQPHNGQANMKKRLKLPGFLIEVDDSWETLRQLSIPRAFP